MKKVTCEKLTGLLYYDCFIDEAQEIIDNSDGNLALLSFNINDFTYINHKYGYIKGDDVLLKTTEHFARDNERVVLASRAYSDHLFVIYNIEGLELTPESLEDVLKRGEFVRRMKQEFPLVAFEITVGVYLLEKGENASAGVDKVEIARRAANVNHRLPIVIYRDELLEKEINQKSVVPMFKNAIEDGRIEAYYQPKINSQDGKVVGAEALARIINVEGDLLSPYQFVQQLEETGLICDLDLFILEQVLTSMVEWKQKGMNLVPVSINLSRVDFYDEYFMNKMKEVLEKYPVDREYIVFEVTETMFFDDVDYMIAKAEEIKELGYKMSLDDFGSGYNSLSMVSKLPVDEIKFDRSFVQNSIHTDRGVKLIKGLIDTIKGVELEVISEGIETKSEEKIMQDCGCDVIQGYIYDKPLTKEDFCNKYLMKL